MLFFFAIVGALAQTVVAENEVTTSLDCGRGKWFDPASSKPECLECPRTSWCPGDGTDNSGCRLGHTGFMCAKCDDGYFYKKRRCQSCPEPHVVATGWLMMTLSGIFIVVLIYRSAALWLDMTTFTIVSTHFQLLFVFFNFGFEYPKTIGVWVRALGFFTGPRFLFEMFEGSTAPECLGNWGLGYTFWWVGKMATPFAFMAPFAGLTIYVNFRQRKEY